MKIEYHKWWSPNLHQDMELKVYGYYGKPMVIFPAMGGRFFEFEDFGMVDAVHDFIESGRIKIYTVDSVDNQSWANYSAHPADRARRHEDYDRYITLEVAPFIRQDCSDSQQKMIASGVSMGAYHCANFFFRHPDLFDTSISLSGLFQLRMFVGDYLDEFVYYNSPLYYLPNLNDRCYLDQYLASKIIICVGQGAWEGPMLEDGYALKRILESKQVPAWLDVWGNDVNHDWPWWRRMLPYHLNLLDLPGYSNEGKNLP